MSERVWTSAQKDCIDARSGPLLVSAAAGSGKTAVLITRILERIVDPADPIDVDRLLVVTFTNAAAAEMKQRLGQELTRRIAAQPDNARLRRQQMLLPHAAIGTVHGFCQSLLRDHFHLLNLSPTFRVAEPTAVQPLLEDALSEVLEEFYAEQDADFLRLSAMLGNHRNDNGLAEAVRQVYHFTRSHPFPNEWMAAQAAAFADPQPPQQTLWGQYILQSIRERVQGSCTLLNQALAVAAQDPVIAERCVDVLRQDLAALERLAADTETAGWDELAVKLDTVVWGRFPVFRNLEDPSTKDRVKNLRDAARKSIAKLSELLCGTAQDFRNDQQALYPLVQVLIRLVQALEQRFADKKATRGWLDFNDLEHGALRLLIQKNNGQLTPTPLAQELADWYAEILVDEYQDTNEVQDTLFRALSRDGEQLFMVGDVKQSIYSFRQARPELFIDRRDRYAAYDRDNPVFPAVIRLSNNFRSRSQVTDSVNFVFRQLMTAEVGGIVYDDSEALMPSATFPDGEGYETEFLVTDTSHLLPGDTRDAAEARRIAARIREQMQTLRIREGDDTRPARYGDFCILLRSKASHAQAYVKQLAQAGIPAWTSSGGGFFAAPEIRVALSLLQCIDNPLLDVPLAAVMLSPAFGFRPDDLASIRLFCRDRAKLPFCLAVKRVARTGRGDLARRCEALMQRLDRWRTLAVSLPADRLIQKIYDESGLLHTARAARLGEQRVANLQLLHSHARHFEQDGFRGLSAFVRWLNRMEQQSADLAPASALGGDDAVKILSVHQSKGLEYPVVYLAGLGVDFNKRSTQGMLLLHADTGFGLKQFDPALRSKFDTVSYRGTALAISRSEYEEELRVLYVAMTRAKEKLCLVMSGRNMESRITGLAALVGDEPALSSHLITSASCMGDWLLAAALRHPSATCLRQSSRTLGQTLLPADHAWRVEMLPVMPTVGETEVDPDTTEAAVQPDIAYYESIQAALDYQYPYAALSQVPVKLAASKLAEQSHTREFSAQSRPAFMSTGGLTPAQRGTALHAFMQLCDLRQAADDPQAAVDWLADCGLLTEQQIAVLPIDKIRRFFAGDLYRRMAASPKLWREFRFVTAIPLADYPLLPDGLPPEADGETILLQGMTDCVFEEADGLVVVDYKTDRVDAAELAARYAPQIHLYAKALAEIFEKPVRECLLYSFHLSETVVIPLETTVD